MDTFLCQNETLTIGKENVGNSFYWNTGEETQTIEIEQPGIYNVLVKNECGESFDEIEIVKFDLESNCEIRIPNAFTPNNDNVNDSFGIITECCIISFHFKIFNRWGNLIFETDNLEKKWEGKEYHSDVYIWKINYSYLDTNRRQVNKIKKGNVTLIR